jgi:hypothetical protein
MLFREIITLLPENHTKFVNTICGQSAKQVVGILTTVLSSINHESCQYWTKLILSCSHLWRSYLSLFTIGLYWIKNSTNFISGYAKTYHLLFEEKLFLSSSLHTYSMICMFLFIMFVLVGSSFSVNVLATFYLRFISMSVSCFAINQTRLVWAWVPTVR